MFLTLCERRVSARPREHHVFFASRVVFFCVVSQQSYSYDVSGGEKHKGPVVQTDEWWAGGKKRRGFTILGEKLIN